MLLVSPPVVLLMLFLPNGHVVSTCSALIGPFNWGEGLFMKAFVCLLRLGEINFCFFSPQTTLFEMRLDNFVHQS